MAESEEISEHIDVDYDWLLTFLQACIQAADSFVTFILDLKGEFINALSVTECYSETTRAVIESDLQFN